MLNQEQRERPNCGGKQTMQNEPESKSVIKLKPVTLQLLHSHSNHWPMFKSGWSSIIGETPVLHRAVNHQLPPKCSYYTDSSDSYTIFAKIMIKMWFDSGVCDQFPNILCTPLTQWLRFHHKKATNTKHTWDVLTVFLLKYSWYLNLKKKLLSGKYHIDILS